MKEHDVIVVGAGPAGSTAAQACSSLGADVLMVEKKPWVGGSCCAGYVSAMDYTISTKKPVLNEISCLRTHFPDGRYHDFPIRGYIVDRRLFDQALISRAIRKGVKVKVRHELIEIEEKKDSCILSFANGKKLKARLVIGCDGPKSLVASKMGWENDFAVSVQYEVLGCEKDSSVNDVFFDYEIAPGCYIWSFALGEKSARIGLAVRKDKTDRNALSCLQEFLNRPGFKHASRINLCGGLIPVGGLSPTLRKGRLLIAGDAAGMADPVTGAGISYAMTAGRHAGRISALGLDEIDHLEKYPRVIKRVLGSKFEHALGKRKNLDSIADNIELSAKLPNNWVTFSSYWK